MEQAAIQAAKNKQPDRVRAEIAEEILKQKEQNTATSRKSSDSSKTDPDRKNNKDPRNFKNRLYSKEGELKKDSEEPAQGNNPPPQVGHIDFTV